MVENLDRGAVENWLVRVFRSSRQATPRTEWTFYCALGRPGRLDDEVRRLGGVIIYSPVPIARIAAFMRHLRRTIRAGRFDVLHCHHDYMSGFYLLAALGLPLRRRIVHVHNADRLFPSRNRWKVAIMLKILRSLCLGLSDQLVGISNHTLDGFLGGARRRLDRVVYYATDYAAPDWTPEDRRRARRELGVPDQGKLVLFAGRMDWFKNPSFLIEALPHMLRVRSDVYMIFAGAGPLEHDVARMARERNLEKHVQVLGWRDDISGLMQMADLMIFPRAEKFADGIGVEGLGLVVVEAQAAGLPVLLSYGVPVDAIVMPELVERMPLSDGPAAWGRRAADMLGRAFPRRGECSARIRQSRFGLRPGTADLIELYNFRGGVDGALV